MQRYGTLQHISKVKTLRCAVKTHDKAFWLADAPDFAYFCAEMRIALRIAYWLMAIVLLSALLLSLDFTLAQAVLLGLIFCPCALALEFLMPKARKPQDKVFLSLAIMLAVVLLILILHFCVWTTLSEEGVFQGPKQVPPMLINPVFLGLILTALSIGDFFWSKWLSKRFKAKGRTITFFSERKSVTLPLAEIAYIESNDTEVRIVAVSGDAYRNRTGIGQWENLLGADFLRIHRSYLVNVAQARLTSPETVTVGTIELPVSRKYKDAVQSALVAAQ